MRRDSIFLFPGDAVSKSSTIFYEIQGLLNITKRKECILIIVTRRHIRYVTVQRDEEFWIKNMLDKLVNFYETTLLPKLSEEMLPRKFLSHYFDLLKTIML